MLQVGIQFGYLWTVSSEMSCFPTDHGENTLCTFVEHSKWYFDGLFCATIQNTVLQLMSSHLIKFQEGAPHKTASFVLEIRPWISCFQILLVAEQQDFVPDLHKELRLYELLLPKFLFRFSSKCTVTEPAIIVGVKNRISMFTLETSKRIRFLIAAGRRSAHPSPQRESAWVRKVWRIKPAAVETHGSPCSTLN